MASMRFSAAPDWVSARLLGRVPALKTVGDLFIEILVFGGNGAAVWLAQMHYRII